jgi:hypothetical protein
MRFQIRFLFPFILLLAGFTANAQQPDSLRIVQDSTVEISTDSVVKKKGGPIHRFLAKDYPKPGRAALLSLILPGAGQAYNKKWWKLPIVYGALGTAVYFEIDNVKQYRELRDNYELLVDNDPNTNPTEPPYNQIDAVSMKTYRDQWRRYVEVNSLVLGILYLMQVADAYVDAHLTTFDVSDDLSLRFQPKMEAVPGFGATFGAGVSLHFGQSRQQKNAPKQF